MNVILMLMQDYLDTPDYTVCLNTSTEVQVERLFYYYFRLVLTIVFKDSDTNPNTTASSVAGDTAHIDGRKKRSEATQLRKSIFGKKHSRLDESKVMLLYAAFLVHSC